MNNPKWALEHEIATPKCKFDSKNIIERNVNSFLFGIFIRKEGSGLDVKQNIEKFFFDDSSLVGDHFLTWLENVDCSLYQNQLAYLVKGTQIADDSAENLFFLVRENFKQLKNRVRRQFEGFDKKLLELKEQFGDNAIEYKAVNYRKKQFLVKNLLNYLAEDGFLPNAGLPTGIVDFEKTTKKDIEKNKVHSNPSYSISRALTEFAPGNNILIDGLNYKSSGIVMLNNWGESSTRDAIQGCTNCGYQRIIGLKKVNEDCPECNTSHSFKGIELTEHRDSFTYLVEPSGFSTDLFKPPTRVISEKSKPQYLEPLLLGLKPWKTNQNNIIDFRSSSNQENAEILFYNTGEGNGYSLCFDCGRVETSNDKLDGHLRLRGGKNSSGESRCDAKNTRDNIILGSKFKTDFTEIRLKNSNQSFVKDKKLAYSLGVIFTKSLAEFLGIEEAELGFGVKHYKGYQTIFIYDTAKSGAGYASQFNMFTKKILKLALKVLEDCPCESTGCTRCLVDRSSQWHIEDLDRFSAIEWLRSAIKNQLPKELEAHNDKINLVLDSLKDEIERIGNHYEIKEISIHINNKVSDWNIEDINKSKAYKWLNNLKRDRIKINLIIEGAVRFTNNQEKLSAYLLSHNFNLRQGNSATILDYPIHLSVTLQSGKTLSYISKGSYDSLNEEWTASIKEKFFTVEGTTSQDYGNFIVPDLASGNLYESRIKGSIPRESKSNVIAQLLLNNLKNKQDFISKIIGQRFEVSYYDKFNQSEFSLRLLLQFLNEFKTLIGVEVSGLNIHLSERDFRSYKTPEYIIDNYQNLNDYQNKLSLLNQAFEFNSEVKIEDRLPHYRYFDFRNDTTKFTLRIDAGLSHGISPVEYLKPADLRDENEVFEIRKYVSHDLIYNINIEE